MRAQDLQPGTRIRNGVTVCEIRQCNLFVNSRGSLIGGAVLPRRADERYCRGFSAAAVLKDWKVTRAPLTVS